MPRPRRSANRAVPTGFSLIELLVVIAIIAVLAGMLLPAIRLVKAQAQQSRCASSQRQVFIACQAYGNDWDGLLPRLKQPMADPTKSTMWFNDIATYLDYAASDGVSILAQRGVLWGCPAWQPTGMAFSTSRPGVGMTWYPYSPAANTASMFWLDPSGGWNPAGVDIAITRITNLAKRIMLGDAQDWHLFFSYGAPGYYPTVWDPTRHGGRANYTFFDGHVQAIAASANTYLGCSNPAATGWNP